MICPKCKELGQKSIVYIGATSTTCVYYAPFYCEDGIYHYHNPNGYSKEFTCSEGHQIRVTGYDKCPNCDFGFEQVISVGEGLNARGDTINLLAGGDGGTLLVSTDSNRTVWTTITNSNKGE